MAATKSMTDIAYDIVSSKKRAIPFIKLWGEVSKLAGVGNDQIAQFYSDLTLDSRFVNLKENKWDLKSRRLFEETHVDIKGLELTDEDGEEEDDNSDEEEEKELNSEENY